MEQSAVQPAAAPAQTTPTTNVDSPQQEEGARGRRRTREGEEGDDLEDGDDDDQPGNGSSKRRRRSRKGLDKKFECPHEGCGKSYSRAEHLYRHQLNHNPKQIYNCDFPDCQRSFVRQDLCARHKERHTAKGSQLLRKENFIQNLNPIVTAAMQNPGNRLKQAQQQQNAFATPQQQHQVEQSPSIQGPGSTLRTEDSTPLDPSLQSTPMDMTMQQRHSSEHMLQRQDSDVKPRLSAFSTPTPYSSHGPVQPYRGPHPTQSMDVNGNHVSTPSQPAHLQRFSSNSSQSPAPYHQHHNFPPLTQLPPPGYATMTQAAAGAQGHHGVTSAADGITGHVNAPPEQVFSADGSTPTYAMTMFGGDGYSRSPFAMADDFTAWLFNDSGFNGANNPPVAYPNNNGMYPGMAPQNTAANFSLQAPYFSHDPMVTGQFATPAPPQQHPMAVSSLIDGNMQQVAMSEERRQQLLDIIDTKFTDNSYEPVMQTKKEIMEGDRDDDRHILSLHMMQTYIGSYWYHFHPQMPILHKPTFSANNCPELLLIAVMALGASCLEKTHGYDVTQNCAELSGFLAWHLRWAIFMHADFRPPAKLWVFQALLLLEVFEKMYSTRPLHERAHIHHATTLTLMRRGSSLIGRSSVDSPPNGSASNTRSGSINGTLSSSGPTNQFSPDEWWNQWITNEATRRAAFAAFVMDSIHATMFGHSAVMVAHEMRLPLPCDEALWSATSSAEVGRVEQSLHQNGIKPVTFLEGLKRTLNGQTVRTNSFGRTILMAGLLSVSWHMNQRDLQVSSLGAMQALGGRDRWRGSLTRAFDFWKLDLDESYAKSEQRNQPFYAQQGGQRPPHGVDDENVFESRTVLHHLAHMAMHVDIVDCQIFAGAARLLGRGITPQDYNGAQRRMKENWAPTARARDATFFALRFLSQVLLSEHPLPFQGNQNNNNNNSPGTQSTPHPHQSPLPTQHGRSPSQHIHSTHPPNAKAFNYSARDDYLLNRPWVLYFACLIVWSYGFALDGPIRPLYKLDTHAEIVEDMQGYLRRVGGVRSPDDLAKLQNRNACLGLLLLMRDTFAGTRWELLHEASRLLGKCIDMLSGGRLLDWGCNTRRSEERASE